MRSQCNKKRHRKLNTLKCCSKYLHICTPQGFFSPSNWKVVALQTDTQTQSFCCLQWQTTPSPELKVTAPFSGGGGLFQPTRTLHSAKLLFFFYYIFGQCFYSNCPRTLCLNGAITCGSFQRTFQAFFFSPQRQSSKGSIPLCEADETSRGLGKEGVGRSSCPQLLGRSPFP